jgi:DNA-directed RNA polymerase subunit RPC12/RpoP
MSIVLNCSSCGKRYELDDTLAGKKARCKDCGVVFMIPVPKKRASDTPRSPAARPAPAAPPTVWEAAFDDEPRSLKGSRVPAAPSNDEADIPPPRRAIYSQSVKKSNSHRHRGSGASVGLTIAGGYLALAVLVVMAFGGWLGAAQPEIARVGQVFALTSIFVRGTTLVLCIAGVIWTLRIAFIESLNQGLLCLFVPCYSLFYVFSRWEETKGAFVLQLLPLTNWFVFFAIGFAIGFAGKAEALNGLAGNAEAAPNGFPVAAELRPDFMQPGFRQPGAPPPGQNGNAAGARERRTNMLVPNTAAQLGGQTVRITVSGMPTNTDPSQGVTARDVSVAIQKRARELAPTATRASWSSAGRQMSMSLAPVDDIAAFASRIDFGSATVSGNQVLVEIRPDYIASVPRLPAENPTPDIDVGPRARTRNRQVLADSEIGPNADAVTKSLSQLQARETHVRKNGLARLVRTEPDDRLPDVVKSVLPLLEDDDSFLVSDAIKALAVWNSPEVVPPLIKLTRDDRFGVRHEAIKALGKIKDPRGVEPILQRIKQDGFEVADALEEIGSIAEPALIERLTNPDSEIRRQVCDILKVIGGKATLNAMKALPSDPDGLVRMAANDAMNKIAARVGSESPGGRKTKTKSGGSRER